MMRLIRYEKARRQAEEERQRISHDAERIRARCQTLTGFREAWHVLEPTQPYIHGWHIDAICSHLEANTTGRLLALGFPNRLLINVPPRTMKSLFASIFWPAWEWGPQSMCRIKLCTRTCSAAKSPPPSATMTPSLF